MITDNFTQLITATQSTGMKIGDWMTLFGILIALGLGAASLIQTEKLKRGEHNERLLQEIIQWAYRILVCNNGTKISAMEHIKDNSFGLSTPLSPEPFVEWESEFFLLETQGRSLLKYISSAKFEQHLIDSVDGTLNKLETQTSHIGPVGYSWQGLRDDKESLDSSVKLLISKILDAK